MPLTTAHGVYTVSMACFTSPIINLNTCFTTKVYTDIRNSFSPDNDSKYPVRGRGTAIYGLYRYVLL